MMMMTDMGKVYFGKRREEEEKVRWVAGSQTPARTQEEKLGSSTKLLRISLVVSLPVFSRPMPKTIQPADGTLCVLGCKFA